MSLLQQLKAYYVFASGSITTDSEGGNTLTDNNSVSSIVGVVGSGVEFSSSANAWLSAANSSTFTPGDITFSFGAWANIRSKDLSQWIMTSYQSASDRRNYLFFYNSAADRFEFRVSPDGTSTNQVGVIDNVFGSPTLNTWYWVYAWHDAVNNELGIQINDNTPTIVQYDGGVNQSLVPEFNIGALASASVVGDISIDEAGIWHRILTPQERLDVYNSGLGNAYPFIETSELVGDVNLTNGLISYYNFDQQNGVRFDINNGNDLSPRNGPLSVVSALVGSGIETDSITEQHLAGGFSSNLAFVPNQSFSIYSLLQLTNLVDGGTILSKDNSASGLGGYKLRYSAVSSRLLFSTAVESGISAARLVASDTIGDVPQDQWLHTFSWYDASNDTLNMEINMSGVNTTAIASGGNTGAQVPLFVQKGYFSNGTEEFFTGIIDEIGIWNRVLTGNERNTIYNNGSGLSFVQFDEFSQSLNSLWLFF